MKSKSIHLVLVTALLASCNRVIIPDQSAAGNIQDSSLTVAPAYDDDIDNCACGYNFYYPFDYYSYYSFNYSQPWLSVYRPGRLYRKQAFWQNHQFVVKGGFGRAAGSSAS